MNIEQAISYYIGKVVRDKKCLAQEPEDRLTARELDRDRTVLAALRCAAAHGFTGEE